MSIHGVLRNALAILQTRLHINIQTRLLRGGANTSCTNHQAYNCHTYAWHNGVPDTTDPVYDLNFPLWDDSPTNELAQAESLDNDTPNRIGDRVVYYDENNHFTHSGIVTSVDDEGNVVRVTSKWGEGSIYDHFPSDVPVEYGATRKYFRLPEVPPEDGGDECTIECETTCGY